MTAPVPNLNSRQEIAYERLLPAFMLALSLHAGLYLLLRPALEQAPVAAPVRIAVQLAQMSEPVTAEPEIPVLEAPQPEPPQQIIPQPPEPKPQQSSKPILTARDDTPPTADEVLVPEQLPEAIEEAVTPEPEPVEPELPKPEPPNPKPVKAKKAEPEPAKPSKPVIKVRDEPPPPAPEEQKVEQLVEAANADSATAFDSVVSDVASASATDSTNGQSSDSSETEAIAWTEEASRDEAWKGYGQLLYAMVSKNKTYPQQAIRRHLEGRVMVSARFSKGKLVEVVVIDPGSGHTILDKAALSMLEKAVQALPVHGDLSRKSFTVVVPVDFRLTG